MSKGARKRELREEKILAEQKATEQKIKQKKKTILISAITAVCLVIVTAASIVAGVLYGNYLDTGDGLRNSYTYKTENFTVDNAMMSYYIYDTYYSVVDYYGSQLASWGLDTSKSIKKQIYSDNQTWFEFFAETAISTAKQTLTLAEEAHKNGVSLSEEEISAIKTKISSLDPASYGRGITSDDILRAESLSYLAAKYDDIVISKIDTSDKALDAYFEEHKDELLNATYRMYSFYFDDDDSDDSVLSKDEAKAFAEDLAKTTTGDEYADWLREYIPVHFPDLDEYALDAEIEYSLVTNGKYSDEYESLKWVYDEKREPGETYIEYDEGYKCYSVYMIVTPYKEDTSPTVNVRHILLSADKYGSEEEASKQAKSIYDEWKSSDGTEEGFAVLALAHSEDVGSAAAGGLYENVKEGEMVTEFNDWCFNEGRKPGDSGIISTSYGIHIMYYSGKGLEAYKAQVKEALINEEYPELFSTISANTNIKDNSKSAYDIPEKKL